MYSTSTSSETLTCRLSSKNATVFHRTVPRASSDPDRPTAYIGQSSGPLVRPILSHRLWKRIGEKDTAPPKSTRGMRDHSNLMLRCALSLADECLIIYMGRAEELSLPTACQLYEQHSLNFLHKIHCTGEPEALSSQLQVNSTLRSRSTRQDADLALPRVRTEAGRRRLLFGVVQSYNRLPLEIRDLSLRSFK